MHNIIDLVDSQVIASVKNKDNIKNAAESKSNIIFLLTGELTTTGEYLNMLQNKNTFLHIDFIDGLSNSKSAIKFIAKSWKPIGIITTRPQLIKYAKAEGLMAIQRIFLIDKNGLNKGIEMAHSCKPDAIEVLPGIMPNIIDEITKITELPIIAGGLISNKNQILDSLEAGALAISSGDPNLWNLNF